MNTLELSRMQTLLLEKYANLEASLMELQEWREDLPGADRVLLEHGLIESVDDVSVLYPNTRIAHETYRMMEDNGS